MAQDDQTKKVICNLRIDPSIKEAAIKAAKADRRTLTSLIEVLLENHCKQHGHMPRP
jgi:hypothetical protein